MRKRSSETELRHIKRALKLAQAAVDAGAKNGAARRLIGSQMSNVCWNLAQGRELTDRDRTGLGELCKAWDALPK